MNTKLFQPPPPTTRMTSSVVVKQYTVVWFYDAVLAFLDTWEKWGDVILFYVFYQSQSSNGRPTTCNNVRVVVTVTVKLQHILFDILNSHVQITTLNHYVQATITPNDESSCSQCILTATLCCGELASTLNE